MVDGVKMASPLLVVILLIGIVDIVFAVDSIPAIFAITTDPFIVLTSNVFAILGLRAMYFLLANMHERFHLLSYGLAIVLVFIGAKMLLIDVYKIPVVYSLGFTTITLAVTMILSLKIPPKGTLGGAYWLVGTSGLQERESSPRQQLLEIAIKADQVLSMVIHRCGQPAVRQIVAGQLLFQTELS